MLIDSITNRACFTMSQARRRSDLSNVYLAQLLRKGTLEGFKIDRDWFIYSDSLERFLALPRKSGPHGPRKKPDQALPSATATDTGERGLNQHQPDSV